MATVSDEVVVKLSAEIAGLQRGMSRGAAAVEGVEKKMAASAARMRTAFAALGGAAAISGFVKLADGWRGVRNQLLVSGVAVDQLDAKLNDLFGVAQRHGADIKSLSVLYGRLAQSANELGANEQQMLKFVDGVATALRVQGGGASQATGALLQLSQAMGSAVVRAEEFNSINEGARPILIAVANGLEAAGGSVSKLRNLVVEGKVTSQAFFQAFLTGSTTIQEMAGRTEGTVSQSMTRLENSFTRFTGKIDGSSGASRGLATAVDDLAKKLDDPQFAEGMATALSGLVGLANTLSSAIAGIGLAFSDLKKLVDMGPLAEAFGIEPSAAQKAGKANESAHNRAKRRAGFVAPSGGGAAGNAAGATSSAGTNEAARAAERYRDVVADLRFELQKLAMGEQQAALQQQLRNALSAAGVTLESQRGQAIAALVEQINAQTAAQAEQAAAWEVEAANANRAIEEMHDAMRAAAAEWGQIGATIEDSIADAFVEMAFNAENAQEIIAGLIVDIGKLIAKTLLLKAIEAGVNAVFPGTGTVGGKALGGLANAGNPYIVGEQGPELFIPNVDGNIVPKGRLGGAPVIINSTVNAGAGVSRAEFQMALEARDKALARAIPKRMIDMQRRSALQGAF